MIEGAVYQPQPERIGNFLISSAQLSAIHRGMSLNQRNLADEIIEETSLRRQCWPHTSQNISTYLRRTDHGRSVLDSNVDLTMVCARMEHGWDDCDVDAFMERRSDEITRDSTDPN